MRIATYKNEESLTMIVNRLYLIEGPGSRSRRAEAEKALLASNPHLKDLRKLEEGALIVVPVVAEVKESDEPRMVEMASDEILEVVRQTLVSVAPALEESIERRTKSLNSSLDELKTRGLRKISDESPGLKNRLPGIREELRSELKTLETRREFQSTALSMLEDNLQEMTRTLSIPGLKHKRSPKHRKQRTVYHVVYHKDTRDWRVLEENKDHPESVHSTKDEAVGRAKTRAKSQIPSQIIVHGRDGKIQYENTYGDDPRSSPG